MFAHQPTLRARCAAMLRTLDIPDPFCLQTFCEKLATHRERPILLRAMHIGVGLCGLWFPTATTDLVFYEEQTSPAHQTHIILHELSHMLLGHEPKAVDDSETLSLLLPDVSPGAVRYVLERTTYSAVEEQEAEFLASLILARLVPTEWHRQPSDQDAAQLLRRLSSALEDSPGTP